MAIENLTAMKDANGRLHW